jgi:hypothetical protein
MIENARYLTPDQEKGIEGFAEKQKVLMEHLMEEAQAEAMGKHLEWANQTKDMIKSMSDMAETFGTHGKIVVMRQMEKDMQRKQAELAEAQELREKYGDQYQNVQNTVKRFAYQAIDGMNSEYASHIKSGKVAGEFKPITMRVGLNGIEAFNIKDVRNVQELREFGPETLANVDLDELMPDAEEFREDKYWEDDKVEHSGWVSGYAETFKEKGQNAAEERIETEFRRQLNNNEQYAHMTPEWKRNRFERVYKYHPELKDKTLEDIQKMNWAEVNKYLPKAETKRVGYINEKRRLKEEQDLVRAARTKERDAQIKGINTRTYIADATAQNMAKWNAKEHPGIMRTIGKVAKGVIKVAPSIIDGYVNIATMPDRMKMMAMQTQAAARASHRAEKKEGQEDKKDEIIDNVIDYAAENFTPSKIGETVAAGAAYTTLGLAGGTALQAMFPMIPGLFFAGTAATGFAAHGIRKAYGAVKRHWDISWM